MVPSTFLAIALAGRLAAAYTWPNRQMEMLDSMRFEQAGEALAGAGSAFFVSPCNQFFGGDKTGRINAADWLRTAYHDMATHDATTGIGGLDASIQFDAEQSRAENAGDGFKNTIPLITAFTGPQISLADAIALGAVHAVEACGGDPIAFRGGRVDATGAGPAGVPQPQDTLDSHKASFARQGFTPSEMIELVACGHSLGGVQNVAFPTIAQTPPTVNNTAGAQTFDSTFAVFDNKIATDYISGKTNNPLVVGPNVTTRSDARIFSSDGNATMKAFAASQTLFKATCSTLFARMLDTVPRGVQLTEVVQPIAAKPNFFTMARYLNGTLGVSASVRFWGLGEDASQVVKFVWAEASGVPCPTCSFTMTHDSESGSSIYLPGNVSSAFYDLPGFRNAGAFGGLMLGGDTTKFWFELTQHGRKTVLDQGGAAFPLQTTALVAEGSCQLAEVTPFSTSIIALYIRVAVVKSSKPSRVWVEVSRAQPGPAFTYAAQQDASASANNSRFDIWAVNITDPNAFFNQGMNAAAEIGGRNITEPSRFQALPACV